MKKLFVGTVAAYFLASLAGCTAETLPSPDIDDNGLYTFSLGTGSSVSVDTRAYPERTLSEVWVVQLNKAGTAALMPPQQVVPYETNKIRVRLEKVDSKVYFFANTGNPTLFNSNAALSSFTTATVEATQMTHNGDWTEKPYIPMYGIWEGTPQTPVIADTPNDKVELTCAFAEVKIILKSGTDYIKNNLYVESMQIKNVPNVLHIAPNTVVDAIYPVATGTFVDYAAIDIYTPPVAPGELEQSYQFYMPENCRGIGSERYETEKNGTLLANAGNYATYLEVKGRIGYYGSLKLCYRFFLGENSVNDYNIRRNNSYTVNITISGINPTDARMTIEANSMSPNSDEDVVWGDSGTEILN